MIFGSGKEMAIITPGSACCQILPSKPISEPGSWYCCHYVDDVVFVVVVVLFLCSLLSCLRWDCCCSLLQCYFCCLCCLVGHDVVVIVILAIRRRRGYYQIIWFKWWLWRRGSVLHWEKSMNFWQVQLEAFSRLKHILNQVESKIASFPTKLIGVMAVDHDDGDHSLDLFDVCKCQASWRTQWW